MRFSKSSFGIVLCFLLMLLVVDGRQLWGVDGFFVPDNLKDNVSFWKQIYTGVSLEEGLFHDSRYPLIVYKRVRIGNRTGRNRRNFIRGHKREIVSFLKRMRQRSSARWSEEERRLADLFKTYAGAGDLKDAHNYVRFQQGQKERFRLGLERSGAYMPFIFMIFKIYRIPDRIAYLPHVESSFNINAYSKAGAAGMWQFMRGTGRLFDLDVNYRIDERRDPFKSTIAAARLLRKNYNQLKAWPLAITAYNHGLGSIKRAVAQTGTRDLGVIIEKYKNRRFRFASKNFYSCFLAASEIAANARSYFPDIRYHPVPTYNETVLDRYLKPRDIVRTLGITPERLAALNPSLRSIVFRRQLPIPRGFKLRIPDILPPADAAKKLAALSGGKAPQYRDGERYYTVRKGDTLYRISRRYGVSTSALIMANEIDGANRIYIGQVLRIPGKVVAAAPTKTAKPVAESIAKSLPKPAPRPKPVKKTVVASASASALKRPVTDASTEDFDATIYSLGVKVIAAGSKAVITVSIGENLGLYAGWLNVPVSQIRRLNHGRRNVRLNQRIRIPLKNGQQSLQQFKARRLEYHMAEEEDFYSQYHVAEIKYHRVRSGDTVWSICSNEEETPLWLLKKFNRGVNIEALSVDAKLAVPVITSRQDSASGDVAVTAASNK